MLSVMIRGTGDRRVALGKTITLLRQGEQLSLDAAAAKAGMSATTWKRVEDGKTVRGLTYRAVEDLLHLPRGIIDDYIEKKVPLGALNRQPEPEQNPLLDSGGLTGEQLEQVRALIRAMRQDRNA